MIMKRDNRESGLKGPDIVDELEGPWFKLHWLLGQA